MFIWYQTVIHNSTWKILPELYGIPLGDIPVPFHNSIEIDSCQHCSSLRDIATSFRGVLRYLIFCKSVYYGGNLVEVRCFRLLLFLQCSILRFHQSGNLTFDLVIPGLLVYFALEFINISLFARIISCGETLK